MPAARRLSSDRVTIDSSPRRKLSQNADTESAPGNLPAMPTTAIALGGSDAGCEKDSLPLLTLDLLPFAGPRRAAAMRHAAEPDCEHRSRSRCCPARRGRVDGSDLPRGRSATRLATTVPPA